MSLIVRSFLSGGAAIVSAACAFTLGLSWNGAFAAPPDKVRLPQSSSFIVEDGKGGTVFCAFSDGKYASGRLVGEYFEPYSNDTNTLKYKIRKARKAGDAGKVNQLSKKLKRKQKSSRAKDSFCAAGPGGDSSDAASMAAYETPLTREDIRYLLEKAGFGLGAKEEPLVALGLASGLDALVTEFMATNAEPDGLMARVEDRRDSTLNVTTAQSPAGQRQAVLDLWAHTNNPYAEKLAFFLLSTWTVSGDVIADETFRGAWWDYFTRLRNAAYGDTSLPDLGVELTRDPLMLIYLNNELNRKGNPNENFARELMELFTLGPSNLDGVANYTETRPDGSGDIAVAARALTGWTVALNYQTNTLVPTFRPQYHEDGPHVMFEGTPHEFSVMNDEDLVRGIFAHHPGAKHFYAAEILREYVTPHPSRGLIENFGAVIEANGYKLRPSMATLFRSKAFFNPKYRDSVLKNPAEFAIEIIRTLRMEDAFNYGEVARQIGLMGMEVNNPPSVFWYSPQGWASPAAILEKANLLAYLFGDSTAHAVPDPDWSPALILPTGPLTPDALILSCATLLGVHGLTEAQSANFVGYINSVRQYDGSFTPQTYNNSNVAHQRQKGLGSIYILAGTPSFQLK